MTIPLNFIARYAIPLIVASLYLGDVDIPQQFAIFDKTQRLTDETLSKAKKEGEPGDGRIVNYDYIIVGGGSAGAVLANRLTASGENTVLLLEAGGDPNPIMEVPYAQRFYWLAGNPMDWNYTTVKQNRSCGFLNNGECFWPRGKALGGSSSVNGLVYNRCKPKDYDHWANFTGDQSWSWTNVKETYNRIEDYHGYYEETNGENHGHSGEMFVGKIDFIPGISVMEEALREKGIPIGDANGGEDFTYGFSRVDYNIKNGLRWGTYQAFLDPILDRPNLSIYRYAYATKIETTPEGNGHRAVGVTYQRHGVTRTAFADKEVILSAGVVESPKLLMLSGIGPRDHLDELNITTLIDLPVGKYLQDHPGTQIHGGSLQKATGFSVNTTFGRNYNTSESVLEFIQNGTGPLNNFAYENGYASQIMMGYLNSSLNPDRSWPELHFYVVEQFELQEDTSVEQFFFSLELVRTNTTGYVKLASNDPKDHPVIDPNFFEDPTDIERMTDGIEQVMNIFLNTTTFQRHGIQPMEPFDQCSHFEFRSRDYWKCFLEFKAVPYFHPTSTCRMGPDSNVAVVDSKLKVFGTSNLRVIDASAIPFAPSGNTNLPAMLIGARGAEIILSERDEDK